MKRENRIKVLLSHFLAILSNNLDLFTDKISDLSSNPSGTFVFDPYVRALSQCHFLGFRLARVTDTRRRSALSDLLDLKFEFASTIRKTLEREEKRTITRG